jgi:hypothetical protein
MYAYDRRLEDLEEDLENIQARIAALKANKSMLQKISDIRPIDSIYVSTWDTGEITAYMSMTVKSFLSSENEELSTLFETFSDLLDILPTSEDMPSQSCRVFKFETESIKLIFSAHLTDSDAVCQRVITGTRVVKKVISSEVEIMEPIYEFKC